ncbi:hypothetical protein HaLaN_06394, partial [Haematococcus lacustris]
MCPVTPVTNSSATCVPAGTHRPNNSLRQSGVDVRSPQHGIGGALILASESMPAQASADTLQLLTFYCSSGSLREPFIAGGVGRPSWGKLLSDIAIYAEN